MKCGLLLCGYVLLLIICSGSCNIHRTLSGNSKHRRLKFPDELIEEIEDDEGEGLLDKILNQVSTAWLCAIPAAILVGSTGILPLLVFNKANCPEGRKLNEAISPAHLKLLLSFSVGGLFGDVFLHLLPEAWMYIDQADHFAASVIGMWIIAGLICFLLIEKIFSIHESMSGEGDLKMDFYEEVNKVEANGVIKNGTANGCVHNGYENELVKRIKSECDGEIQSTEATAVHDVEVHRDTEKGKRIIGYLNLLANCIDNFTHGLAVSGSFVVSIPVGICTTFAILLHEIPHEIGDFAILLQAGFNRWEAAKGQMITASGALFGCVFGLIAEGAGDASSWVLPFTSGGFIYIACVTILPDLVQETSLVESVKQMIALFMGIGIMCLVSVTH